MVLYFLEFGKILNCIWPALRLMCGLQYYAGRKLNQLTLWSQCLVSITVDIGLF